MAANKQEKGANKQEEERQIIRFSAYKYEEVMTLK